MYASDGLPVLPRYPQNSWNGSHSSKLALPFCKGYTWKVSYPLKLQVENDESVVDTEETSTSRARDYVVEVWRNLWQHPHMAWKNLTETIVSESWKSWCRRQRRHQRGEQDRCAKRLHKVRSCGGSRSVASSSLWLALGCHSQSWWWWYHQVGMQSNRRVSKL